MMPAAGLVLALLAMGSTARGFQDFELPRGRADIRPVQTWTDHPDWVTSLAFLKDGRRLCVGTYEAVMLRDTRGMETTKTLAVKPGYMKSLALSPDGKWIAAGHYQTVSLIDVASFSIKRTLGNHAAYVTGVSLSPDGRFLASAGEDGSATVWNVADGKAVHVLCENGLPILGIAFSPDGTQIATAAGDTDRLTQPGEVKVWNAADGKEKFSFTNPQQAATGVAFSPDGKILASTGLDKRVILYDLVLGKATSFFAEHSRPTNAVLFARHGATLVSASGGLIEGNNEVKIWERTSGTELATLAVHAAKVDAIAVSPDESLLATGGYDKAVFLFDAKPLLSHDKRTAGDATAGNLFDAGAIARAVAMLAVAKHHAQENGSGTIRVGMIGLDTSHCAAFAGALNDPDAAADVAGFRVVAVYPRGSADIESSVKRVPEYTKDFQKRGIEIVDSIDTLLKKVDVVLLETNDGRPHLEQALAVMKSGKRLFIDKPIAGSLADAVAIFEASKRYKVPVFSSSSLRFAKATQEARNGKIGKITSCQTESPCYLEKTHPDLFWYGIHGVESLFTVMGPGCKSARRTVSTPTEDVVVGTWEDGRTGTFDGKRSKAGYGGKAQGTTGSLAIGQYDGYRPLVVEIAKFFKTGVVPVSPEETLEIYAFMEAADESKRQHGAEVTLESVLAKARAEAAKKLGDPPK